MSLLILAASSFAAVILPAAMRSAESVPVLILEALILTAFTCVAVSVPVYTPVADSFVSLGYSSPPRAVVIASISSVQATETELAKVTLPLASHDILPEAICPEPSLLSFHFVPFVIEPSLPSDTLPLLIADDVIAHPAILFDEPSDTMQVPAESVAQKPKSELLL